MTVLRFTAGCSPGLAKLCGVPGSAVTGVAGCAVRVSAPLVKVRLPEKTKKVSSCWR